MKITGEKGMACILKIMLQIAMILGGILLVLLPWFVNIFNLHFDLFIILIYPCGISFLYIVYQFIGLFNSLKVNNPFCIDNVKRMKNGMRASYLISLLIFIALFMSIFVYDYYTLQLQVALLFLSILFFGVGIALYILSELFKEAIMYKEENELTI